jgi:hypothetical protein
MAGETPQRWVGTVMAAPPAPRVWCRRILMAVEAQQPAARRPTHLALLLAYCIRCSPTPDGFAALLAEGAHDDCSSLASACRALHQAWKLAQDSSAPCPLPETLRTLGGLLDEAAAPVAYVTLVVGAAGLESFDQAGPFGSEVVAPHWERAARTVLRGQLVPRDPTELGRYASSLRAVGAALDAQPQQDYELIVRRETVMVEGSAGYSHIFTAAELAPLLKSAVSRRQPLA